MSDEAKLTRAREFIGKGHYKRARRILIPLALTNHIARDMLNTLDEAAPPDLNSARRYGIFSTIASLIRDGGIVSLAVFAFFLLMCGIVLAAGLWGPGL